MGLKDLKGDDEERLLIKKEISAKIRLLRPSDKTGKDHQRFSEKDHFKATVKDPYGASEKDRYGVSEKDRYGGSENDPYNSEKDRHKGSDKDSHVPSTLLNEKNINGVELNVEEKWILDPNSLRVGGKIGEGSHGKVYEGRYGELSVAVKVLQRSEREEEQLKIEARFAREADMMSRVHHKNLVKFIGACKSPVMAIVTELLPGRSLRKHLLSLRPNSLDLHIALSFALDIAYAMECLHLNRIIHRDLKPENLLLTKDQKSVKLIDFGLAREESLTEMMTAETGTYRWMAPELYSTITLRLGDKKHYNNKVDVYSFAIVLWELITNRMPFEGMSNLQAAYAAAFKNVRPTIPDGLPEHLVFILRSCWLEDPDARPSFGQIIPLLRSVLSSLPTISKQQSLSPNMDGLKNGSTSKDITISDVESPKCKDDSSDGESPAKSKRRFSCFGQCFAVDHGERLM